MSLAQSLSSKTVPLEEIQDLVAGVVDQIRSVCSPLEIILFGSAAEGRFKVGSDLDFLLVFNSRVEIQQARSAIRKLGLLHKEIPIDLVFVTQARFYERRDLGGVAFIAHHDGIRL